MNTTSAFRTIQAGHLMLTEQRLAQLHADAYRAAIAAQACLIEMAPMLSRPAWLAGVESLTGLWRTVEGVRVAMTEAHVRRRIFLDPPGGN